MKTIRSELERLAVIREVSALPLPFTVKVSSSDRSLSQNALSHVWYGQIAQQDRSMNTAQARRFCKLHFGVPIMRAQEESFRTAWDGMIKTRMSYPEKLMLMDWWPVTSLMDREQMGEYLTAVQEHYAQHGIVLTGNDRGMSEYPEAAA